MSINLTLIGQLITFLIFVGFTMKFVWPHIIGIMSERAKNIADGLAAGERGKYELDRARQKIAEEEKAFKEKAQEIINKAHIRAEQIVDDAVLKSKKEYQKIVDNAYLDIDKKVILMRKELQNDLSSKVILCVEKLLHKNIDSEMNQKMIEQFLAEKF